MNFFLAFSEIRGDKIHWIWWDNTILICNMVESKPATRTSEQHTFARKVPIVYREGAGRRSALPLFSLCSVFVFAAHKKLFGCKIRVNSYGDRVVKMKWIIFAINFYTVAFFFHYIVVNFDRYEFCLDCGELISIISHNFKNMGNWYNTITIQNNF